MFQHLQIPAKLATADIRAKFDEKLRTSGSAQLQGFDEDALAAAAKLLANYARFDVFIYTSQNSYQGLYVFAV
jgi:hypothetical protein